MTAQEQAWHAWRDKGLGASDVPSLLGVSSFGSPWSLWADKTGQTQRTPTSQRQRIGQVLEGAIAQLFEEHTGYKVGGEQEQCTHPVHTHHRATIDGRVYDTDDTHLGLLEIKTDGAFSWPDGPSARIHAQVQWQMHVTGTTRCWVACLHAGFSFDVYEVARDDAYIDNMVERAEHFWTHHVLTGTAPPVDGHDATRDAIGEVWPDHTTGKAADIPADLLVELADLKEAISGLYDEKNRVDAAIRVHMGDAETGLVGGVPVLTLRTQTRKGIDTDALRKDHPDLAAKYQTVTTSRVMRLNPKARAIQQQRAA